MRFYTFLLYWTWVTLANVDLTVEQTDTNGGTSAPACTEVIRFSTHYIDSTQNVKQNCAIDYQGNFKEKLSSVLEDLQARCNQQSSGVTVSLNETTASTVTGNTIKVIAGLKFSFNASAGPAGLKCVTQVENRLADAYSYRPGEEYQELFYLGSDKKCPRITMRIPGIFIEWYSPDGYRYDPSASPCFSTGDRFVHQHGRRGRRAAGVKKKCKEWVDRCLQQIRALVRDCRDDLTLRLADIKTACVRGNACNKEGDKEYLNRKMADASDVVVSYCDAITMTRITTTSTTPIFTTNPTSTPDTTSSTIGTTSGGAIDTTSSSTPDTISTSTSLPTPTTGIPTFSTTDTSSPSTPTITTTATTIDTNTPEKTTEMTTVNTKTSDSPSTTRTTIAPEVTTVVTSPALTTAGSVTSLSPSSLSSSTPAPTTQASSPEVTSTSAAASSKAFSPSTTITVSSLPATTDPLPHSSSLDTTSAPPTTTPATTTEPPQTTTEPPTTSMTTSAAPTTESATTTTPMTTTEAPTTEPATTTEPPTTTAVVQTGLRIKVLTTSLTVAEGAQVQYLEFNLTDAPSTVCKGKPDCQVQVVAALSTGSNPKCKNQEITQAVFGDSSHSNPNDFCQTVVTETDWQETRKIPILARIDGRLDDDQVRQIDLYLILSNGTLIQKTQNEIQLTVVDKNTPAMCKSVGDPHITTFDGIEYNNYYDGEFVLYRHRYLPFEAHVIYQKCGPDVKASCSCAVAVKSGDDVIIVDNCKRRGQEVAIFKPELYANGELTPGTFIYEQNDWKKLAIHLPHRTVIRVASMGDSLNVFIEPSTVDRQSTEGLCGYYDGEYKNDLMWPNNTLYPNNLVPGGPRTQPGAFTDTWRVKLGSALSYLGGVRESVQPFKLKKYCTCQEGKQGVLTSTCGDNLIVSTCDAFEGKNITQVLIDSAMPSIRSSRQKRQIEKNTIDVNEAYKPPTFKWPTPNGMTESLARAYCKKEIENSTIGQLCKQVPNVDFEVEIKSCMEDIQITDNKAWAASALEAMKEQCLQLLKQNSNLDPNIVNSIRGAMCPNECSKQGKCASGKCQCDVPYSGDDCSLNTRDPPKPVAIEKNGICNVKQESCNKATIYGNNIVKSGKLKCHLIPWKLSYKNGEENEVNKEETVPAKYINFNTVECPIPKHMRYNVSVSNDGNKYSKHYVYVPYDPVCYDCDMTTAVCRPKTDSCLINTVCVKSNTVDPSDTCMICSPTETRTQWTRKSEKACQLQVTSFPLSQREKIIIGAACGVLALVIIVAVIKVRCFCRRQNPRVDDTRYSMRDDHSHGMGPDRQAVVAANTMMASAHARGAAAPSGGGGGGYGPEAFWSWTESTRQCSLESEDDPRVNRHSGAEMTFTNPEFIDKDSMAEKHSLQSQSTPSPDISTMYF